MSFFDKLISEKGKQLSEMKKGNYLCYREYYKFGHYPTFRDFDDYENKEKIFFLVYFPDPDESKETGEYKFLNKQELFDHIKENWMPCSDEEVTYKLYHMYWDFFPKEC